MKSKQQQAKEKSESIKAEAMKDVCSIYPHQCHLSVLLAERGINVKIPPPLPCSDVSMAIHYANEVLSTRDFTVEGKAMITSITNPGTSTYAFCEGWLGTLSEKPTH